MRTRNLRDAVIWHIVRLSESRSEESIRCLYRPLGTIYPSVPEDPITARAYRLAFGADSTLPAVFKRTIVQFLDGYSEQMKEVTAARWQEAHGDLFKAHETARN